MDVMKSPQGNEPPRNNTSTAIANIDAIKKMFDSGRLQDDNPFKGQKDLNRTNNTRWVASKGIHYSNQIPAEYGGGEQRL